MKSPNAQAGALFFGASLCSAVSNYLFQVLASTQLTPKEFADLNGWFADVALFYVFAAVLQSQSNFNPAVRAILRPVIIFSLAAAGLFVVFWNTLPGALGLWHGLLIVPTVYMVNWLIGQAQIRLQFVGLAVIGLFVAVAKVVFVLPSTGNALDKFVFVNFLAFVLTLACLGWILWSKDDVKVSKIKAHWPSVILLSIGLVITPQFDMFLMHHTQVEPAFIDFTRASLFGRAVFSLISILAQWLLPSQIRNENRYSIPMWKAVGGVLLFCGLVAFLSPVISQFVFRWDHVPPRDLVFLASSEISMLALMFMMLQSFCAKHNTKPAIVLICVLALEGTVQMTFRFPMYTFLSAALAIQIATLLLVTRFKD